jgi:hypothetical protein
MEEQKTKTVGKLELFQQKIDRCRCFEEISKSCILLSPSKKEKYKKLGVYDEVIAEVQEFCLQKSQQIDESEYTSSSPTASLDTDELIVLKNMARRVLSSAKKNNEPIQPRNSSPKTQTPVRSQTGRRLRHRVNKEKIKQIITEDETKNKDPKTFIGKQTRTVGHDSLYIVDPVNNIPGTYSRVRIDNILDNNRAEITFLGNESRGEGEFKAQINLNELAGFEYL